VGDEGVVWCEGGIGVCTESEVIGGCMGVCRCVYVVMWMWDVGYFVLLAATEV